MSFLPDSTLNVLDMHTAGEPVRIITGGYPDLQGATILDKRRDAVEKHDHLRTILMHEPRGHAGMYGVIPVQPALAGAKLAVLFCHATGYSTMCGHATIAIGRWAVESGQVPHDGRHARFGLELPCGLVQVEATVENGKVVKTAFESVAAYIDHANLSVSVPDLGAIHCDVVFGGAFYAILPASRLNVSFDEGLGKLIEAAAKFFAAVRTVYTPHHPGDDDLSFLYGVILVDDASGDAPSRNLCLFGEAQIDRSPTGSGVTARMALDVLQQRIPLGQSRRFYGPTGDGFDALGTRLTTFHGKPAVHIRVEGRSFYTGTAKYIVEREDPLREGFLLPV